MTQLVIKETRELILAGEISKAEAHLVVVAEQEGDHALVEGIADVRAVEGDAVDNKIILHVSDEELAERRKAWKPRVSPHTSGVLRKYIKNVASASQGCVTDL